MDKDMCREVHDRCINEAIRSALCGWSDGWITDPSYRTLIRRLVQNKDADLPNRVWALTLFNIIALGR